MDTSDIQPRLQVLGDFVRGWSSQKNCPIFPRAEEIFWWNLGCCSTTDASSKVRKTFLLNIRINRHSTPTSYYLSSKVKNMARPESLWWGALQSCQCASTHLLLLLLVLHLLLEISVFSLAFLFDLAKLTLLSCVDSRIVKVAYIKCQKCSLGEENETIRFWTKFRNAHWGKCKQPIRLWTWDKSDVFSPTRNRYCSCQAFQEYAVNYLVALVFCRIS